MSTALGGLCVVELGTEIAAPYCTKLLTDLGADVCKIELPAGDPLRFWGPFRDDALHHGGLFDYLNAGKRGLTIDLGTPSGQAQAHELLGQADLLVEDLPAGSADRFDWGVMPHHSLDRKGVFQMKRFLVELGQHGPCFFARGNTGLLRVGHG